MTLFVFAGPNGSGKSTLVDGFLQSKEYCGITYICPDALADALFEEYADIHSRYEAALKKAEELRISALDEYEDFCIETVLSKPDKIEYIIKAKERGYDICIVYITTESPAINISRVKKRVLENGHSVPEEKIMSRYRRSMNNIPELLELADIMIMYDNSTSDSTPRLVYFHDENSTYIPDFALSIKWIQHFVLPHI